MASEMMHLFVGHVLRERLQVQRLSPFYTGCIAPDSVHFAGNVPKEERWGRHVRHKNLAVWAEQAWEFYDSRPDSADADLWLGYYIHLLTDIAWDAGEHDEIWMEMKQLDLPKISKFGAGWDDCFRFDYQQMHEPWWTDQVQPALLAAKGEAMPGLSAATIEKFAHRIAEQPCECEGIPCPPIRVTRDCVLRLAEQVWQLFSHEGSDPSCEI
jgi:hypothetical protein